MTRSKAEPGINTHRYIPSRVLCLSGPVFVASLLLAVVVSPVAHAEAEQDTESSRSAANAASIASLDTTSDDSETHRGGEVSVEGMCRRITNKLASVDLADCLTLELQQNRGSSVQGLPIVFKEYPPLPNRLPEGRVLLLGGIHGDEYSSISVVFKWMDILERHHSGLFHWRIAPLVNPDGLLRKHARRTNANGVDLNRNFPTPNWEAESKEYWVRRTNSNPRRYPGPAPLSEPESQWLASVIEEFDPDVIVSVHAPFGVLDFDGPSHAPEHLGHLWLNLLGTYPGSLGNYAGVQKRIPVVTIELPHAGIMPSPQEVSDIWVDLVRWLRRNMKSPPERMAKEAQTGPS